MHLIDAHQQQRERAQDLAGVGAAHDGTPWRAIRHLPPRQHQQYERQKLAQAHQAQRQRIARQRIHLPTHGDRQHLPAQRRAAAPNYKAGCITPR